MGVRYSDPPFLTKEEQANADLVGTFIDQLAAANRRVRELEDEVERLRGELDLADLCIARYDQGLM